MNEFSYELIWNSWLEVPFLHVSFCDDTWTFCNFSTFLPMDFFFLNIRKLFFIHCTYNPWKAGVTCKVIILRILVLLFEFLPSGFVDDFDFEFRWSKLHLFILLSFISIFIIYFEILLLFYFISIPFLNIFHHGSRKRKYHGITLQHSQLQHFSIPTGQTRWNLVIWHNWRNSWRTVEHLAIVVHRNNFSHNFGSEKWK